MTYPFMITKERAGAAGGQKNEQFCNNCFCYVCDVKASECQGWLTVGHCHAQDKDPYWRALREFTRTELLSNSPLLQALGCDEAARLEAHRWCVNGLLAFNRYGDGDPGPGGVRNHSFQHVTNVTSSAMKAIVGHLSGAKGPRTTLAVLDGITSAIVINAARPENSSDPKHKWCKGTYAAYKAIIEQLEKYWVLAIVHTSARSIPPQALSIMADRLKRLSKLVDKQVVDGGQPQLAHVPLTHAISACQRGWTNPVVVSILEGHCTDLQQREAQTLQRARLHVLERAQRWKEAYNYAIFHGHAAKSLAYMVRAGRYTDVLPMVFRQSALACGGKCVPVCAELAEWGQQEAAIRLALYCAFADYEQEIHTSGDTLVTKRMPYVQWLVEAVVERITPAERQERNASTQQPSQPAQAVEAARSDASEWAIMVCKDLPGHLANPLPDAPMGVAYSQAALTAERVAALCVITMPVLAPFCAKLLSRHGEHCAAASIVLAPACRSDVGVVTWALQELAPKIGMATFSRLIQELRPGQMSTTAQTAVATALLAAKENAEAVRWTTNANLLDAPAAHELPYAHFENTRNYRPCDLQAFVDVAEQSGDTQGALLLAELQMWWEPSWQHLEALNRLCSPHKYGLRRQQLQSLALNDARCRPEMRFEVLAHEGLNAQAMAVLVSTARENPQAANAALKTGLENLGLAFGTQQGGILDELWPWLTQLVQAGEGVDATLELLAPAIPDKVLPLYDAQVDQWQKHCQQNTVNASTTPLRSWLFRTRRMYQAAGQADNWDRRFSDMTSSLRRKSSLSSVWADFGASTSQQSHPQTPQTPQLSNGGQSSVPSTPANTG